MAPGFPSSSCPDAPRKPPSGEFKGIAWLLCSRDYLAPPLSFCGRSFLAPHSSARSSPQGIPGSFPRWAVVTSVVPFPVACKLPSTAYMSLEALRRRSPRRSHFFCGILASPFPFLFPSLSPPRFLWYFSPLRRWALYGAVCLFNRSEPATLAGVTLFLSALPHVIRASPNPPGAQRAFPRPVRFLGLFSASPAPHSSPALAGVPLRRSPAAPPFFLLSAVNVTTLFPLLFGGFCAQLSSSTGGAGFARFFGP